MYIVLNMRIMCGLYDLWRSSDRSETSKYRTLSGRHYSTATFGGMSVIFRRVRYSEMLIEGSLAVHGSLTIENLRPTVW